jgi:hypothetical protein
MADTSKSPAVAKADDSHDARYTHTSFESPGGPGGRATTPTKYPKWVTPVGKKAVIVNDPTEEASVMSGKGFSRISAMCAMALIALVLIAVPQAVTVLTTTTLSAAVAAPAQGAPANTVRLTAITGVTANTSIYVDLELMRVTVTPTTASQPVSVARAQNGTLSAAHASGATVTLGPNNAFNVGGPPAGPCTGAAQLYSPWIDVQTGNFWVCRGGGTTGTWNGTNIRALTYNSTQTGTP